MIFFIVVVIIGIISGLIAAIGNQKINEAIEYFKENY